MSQNKEPLTAFYADVNGAASQYASVVTKDGYQAIKISYPDTTRYTREVNGAWLNSNDGIAPGAHIYFELYAKTGSYSNWNAPYNGIRMGYDVYVTAYVPALGRTVTGVARPNPGHPSDYENGLPYAEKHWQLQWGQDWTKLWHDNYLPSELISGVEQDGVDYECTPSPISMIVAIVDVREVEDAADAWFRDPILYVNPPINPVTKPFHDDFAVLDPKWQPLKGAWNTI